MLTGNITKFQNGTGFIADKNAETGLSLFQTVLLTLTVISSVALVLFLVYYIWRKRSLDELRHRLVPLYHFDPGECEDWEDELLEDSKKETLRRGHKKNPLPPSDVSTCTVHIGRQSSSSSLLQYRRKLKRQSQQDFNK